MVGPVHDDPAVEWDSVLRARGYRITPQRQLVLQAVTTLGHATPEEVLVEVQRTAAGVNQSTVYRTLDVLESVGLVTHAHIGHGAPTYHPRTDAAHFHLVCDRCHSVESVDAAVAADFCTALVELRGFISDVTHVTVHGTCAACATTQ